jgi:hypothetical protein
MNSNSSACNFDAPWLNERSEYLNEVCSEIKALRDKGAFVGKRIAIVGSWNNAAEISKVLTYLGLAVNIIADNNPRKQGVSRRGIISQSVESLLDEENVCVLVLNNFYWKRIQRQLVGLGFIKDKDFYVLFGGEKLKFESGGYGNILTLPQQKWDEYLVRAADGFAAYEKILSKYPTIPIWLMHQPSIGDLYIFSLFLPVEMGVDCISDCECVLIVTKNSTRKLAEAIGYRHIEMITFEEANRNWLMLLRLMGDRIKLRNAVYHGLNNIFQTLVHCTSVSFLDSFTKYVFHFKTDVSPVFPVFPKRTEHVLSQFREFGLKVGKTVVVSPYAGHFEATISLKQWEYLVGALSKKGYTVCSNCGSAEEPPLPDTVAPFIELQDCVEFVETAGYFIGVRSGFCDLICKANCKKIVIYETGAPAGSIEFFGLENMGIGDGDIIEVINDCIHTDELIEEILTQFLVQKD